MSSRSIAENDCRFEGSVFGIDVIDIWLPGSSRSYADLPLTSDTSANMESTVASTV